MGERCSDKAAIIRIEAVTGLALVYKHVLAAGTQAPQGDSEEEDGYDDKINLDKRLARIGWIPSHVLITFNINDSELKCRILQLLDEILLPKNLSPIDRVDRLIHIFSQLTENAKIVLGRIFSTRRSVQRIVHNFASDRNDTQVMLFFYQISRYSFKIVFYFLSIVLYRSFFFNLKIIVMMGIGRLFVSSKSLH